MQFRSTIGPAVLAIGLAGVGILSNAPAAQAAEAPKSCIVLVQPYEDGSWSGTLAQRADGTVLAHRWDVTGPAQQNTVTPNEYGTPTYHTTWPAEIDGQVCQVWLDHRN